MSLGWLRRVVWFGFAFVFFYAGQSFTVWLLEPHNFNGGAQWFLVVLFPFLLIGFFYINYKLGCVSGSCSMKTSCGSTVRDTTQQRGTDDLVDYHQPPG
jgi:hypothetical protein